MATHVTEEMLNEARKARHNLLIGGGVFRFRDQNGEEVSYAKTDLNKLDAYIRYLESELGVATPVPQLRVWL